MSEELVAGYMAYTNAAEYGADARGDAPASTTIIVTLVSSAILSANTAENNC